ncbi:MAG TPA: excinuclease ABC subunit C [Lentisphaeria bacterium]|nr:MAG: excinuclease ABC subunit C [Lentisphaerae bacterium GWF2_50_93]HCE47037.1 excinuclease ABC subunit C [Lentisphaeria bacterium]
MYYVYIIQSKVAPQKYIGFSEDLKQRIKDHNSGLCPHTSKFKPWKLKFYAAFEEKQRAMDFERYLKSGSGHSFSSRHLI